MKDIAGAYHLLTASERFRLFVEAMGRQGGQELDRLEATGTHRRYEAQDHEYTRKKTLFTVLAHATAARRLQIELLAMAALAAGLASETDDTQETDTWDSAITAFKTFMQVRKGKRDGWLQFCDQIGVNPNAVTASLLGGVDLATEAAEEVSSLLHGDGADEFDDSETIAAHELRQLTDAWGDHA